MNGVLRVLTAVPEVDRDIGTLTGQPEGNASADASRSAGDQGRADLQDAWGSRGFRLR